MAKIINNLNIEFETTLGLNEAEMRALNALTVYGDEEFLKFFYTHLGKYYLQKHETGLKQLFDSIRKIIPQELSKIDTIRKTLSK